MALWDQLTPEQGAVLLILGISLAYLFVVDPLWEMARRQRDARRTRRLLEERTASLDVAVPRQPGEPAVSGLSRHLEGVGFDRGGQAPPRRFNGHEYGGGDAAWKSLSVTSARPSSSTRR
jgi:hypothetical protein